MSLLAICTGMTLGQGIEFDCICTVRESKASSMRLRDTLTRERGKDDLAETHTDTKEFSIGIEATT